MSEGRNVRENPAAAIQRRRDLEVWWEAHPERWPNAPQGHYIGPDGQLLSPVDFATYAADPCRLIVVLARGGGLQGTLPGTGLLHRPAFGVEYGG